MQRHIRSHSRRVVRGLVVATLILVAPIARPDPVVASTVTTAATSPDRLARIDTLRLSYRATDALALIARTLPDARATSDTTLTLALLLRQGSLLSAIGRGAAAEPPLTEAIALAEVVEDSLSLCSALRWLGFAVSQQGRHDELLIIGARLYATATAINDHRHRGWAMVGRASREVRSGNHEQATRYFRRAIALFDSATTVDGRAWARNGLGMSLQHSGDYPAALECYDDAAAIARAAGNAMVESLALNNLGTLAYALGDPGLALERFQRALASQRRIGNLRGIHRPAVNVAICQTDLGRERDAMAGLDSLLAECRRHRYRDVEGSILNQQARLSARAGRHHQAAARYRQALALGDLVPVKNAVETHIGLAAALAAVDSAAAALDLLDQALATAPLRELAEQRLLGLEQRGHLLVQLDRRPEALAQLLAADREASRLGLERHRPSLLAEAARSYLATAQPDSALLLLRQAARIWEAERSLPLDPVWREQRGAAGQLIYTELAAAILAVGPVAHAEPARVAFDALQLFKARTLLERMSGPGSPATPLPADDTALVSQRSAPANTARPVTVQLLQESVLGDDELLLDTYVGPGISWLFAVTRDSVRAVALPTEEVLARKLHDVYRLMAEPPRSPAAGENAPTRDLRDRAPRGLYRLLFAGVEHLLTASRLVFLAPDGCLNLLPTAALNRSGHGPLWARVPSATVLAQLRRHDVREPEQSGLLETPRILALAGSGPGDVSVGDAGTRGAGTLPELPGTEYEVRHLERRYHGVSRRVRDVTDSGATSMSPLAGYDVLHLAAHTWIDDQHPWQSAIHLGTAERVVGPASLRASRIAESPLTARLAVLSGCASATGRVLSGEGVLGLGSAFLSAGVPVVVATLWPVDDRVTSHLMEHFYAELAAGRSVARSMAAARDALRSDDATAAHFYWAGFVVIGDGDVGVELTPRGAGRNTVLLLPLATVLGTLLIVTVARLRARCQPVNPS